MFPYISAVLALVAAWFWFKASRVKTPDAPQMGGKIEAKLFQELFESIKKSAKLNATAAIFAYLSAFLAATDFLLNF
ncbi:hypothetical protein [Thalassospira xiamenensis]|uniref:hypothetical protein n=1 Tax=Thalassospira xiamenensis TaxID=220697 RepID=UPI001E40CC9C|nr:hypothetical protein [Thalassospira xiamenensis]MCD1593366.1 hypothetical protein [Thalassospira xiamenensis]